MTSTLVEKAVLALFPYQICEEFLRIPLGQRLFVKSVGPEKLACFGIFWGGREKEPTDATEGGRYLCWREGRNGSALVVVLDIEPRHRLFINYLLFYSLGKKR